MVINTLNLMSIDMVLSLFSMHTIDFEEIIIEGSRKNIFVFFLNLYLPFMHLVDWTD